LYTYSDLFDDDLDSVAVVLNDTVARLNVGKLWAKQFGRTAAAAGKASKTACDQLVVKSPLSDSNRRPPLYKSGALAN
jgi:hypothetical protein